MDFADEGGGAVEGPNGGIEGMFRGFGRDMPAEGDEGGWIGTSSCGGDELVGLFGLEAMAGDDHVEVGLAQAAGGCLGTGNGDVEALLFEDCFTGIEQGLVRPHEERCAELMA